MESSKNAPQRLGRLVATISVGLVSAACVWIVIAIGGGAPEPARAGSTGDAATAGQAGHVHGRELAVPGMTESELRELETATLGAEHAREHALLREAMREAPAAEAEAEPKLTAAAEPKLTAAAAAAAGVPADVGQWLEAKTKLPIVAIHAALLPTGKVMIFSYPTYPDRPNNAEAWLWDPANPGQPPVAKNPPGLANIWCAGQTFAANGELVVFGGNLDYESPSQTWKGLDKVFTFNPWSETWREQPKMAHGRWYPTGVRMPDGRIPIVSGLDESGLLDPNSHTNHEVELFTPSETLGGLGSIEKIGDTGWLTNDPVKPPSRELYPRMVSMASGKTVLAGPDKESTWYFNDVDANPFTWVNIGDLGRHRTWGTTVPLPSGPGGPTKLLALGGTQYSNEPSTTTTELWDQASPGSWQPQSSNLYGRGHANTVLLPDGSMVEVGGGRGSLSSFPSPLHYAEPETRSIELWDPATKQWTLGPAQSESRAYHSTALLLPDGRVMSAGDEYNGDPGDPDKADSIDTDPSEDTAEIYEPPYLHRGPRPQIASAPATIGFNGTFGVNTPDTNIKRAALVAPAAVTHGVDMNQRVLQLDVVQRTGCVSVTAPTGPNAAPPGYYMLFLLNDQGVPSVAKFVRVVQGGSLGGCGTAAPPDLADPVVDLVAPPAGKVAGTIELRATASDDRGVVGVRFERNGVLIADDTTSPYTARWNTTAVPDGIYTITAIARDGAGKDAADSVQVEVENRDTQGPTVNITSPAPGSTVTGEVTVSANALDATGVRDVQFKVDGVNIGAADSTGPPYSVLWGSINVANGTHTLTAVATDVLGNVTQSAGVQVNVHNEAGEPVDALPPKKPISRPGPPGGGETAGDGPNGPNGPGGADAAPAFSRLKVSPARFRQGKLTRISFRLSEAARVSLTFERKLAGRRVRGRCTKPSRVARPNCTRYVRAGKKLTVRGKAGTNTLGFRGSGLAAGSYRLTLVAKDATGKSSKPARSSFKLLPSRGSAAARAAVLAWF
jgi:hypothetical protein